MKVIFLSSLLAGVASLIGAVGVARLNWRSDVAPFNRHISAFKVLAQPELYAVPKAVALIRMLTYIGYALVGAAILCLCDKFLADVAIQ
jgi:hypothetical protein